MRAKPKRQPPESAFYQDSLTHLSDELRRLDRLIQRRIAALRPQRLAAQGMMASKGVYITHEEVDALLDQEGTDDAQPLVLASDLQETTIADKITASAKRGIFLSLPWIAQLFSLSQLEVQTLIMCLAPELLYKYDTLYAYLQDDITRKRPSVDLVLDVLCPSEAERWRARTAVFSDQAPLFRHGILHKVEDPRSPSGSSGRAQFLQLDQRMLHYILENDALDGRLAGYVNVSQPTETVEQVLVDPTLKTRLARFCERHFYQRPSERRPFVFYFQGPYGVGKRDLALGLCAQWGHPLLYVDMELLLAREPDVATALRVVFREGLLWDAAIYLDHCDALLQEDVKAKAWMKTVARMANEYGQLTFLAGELPWSLQGVFDQDRFCAVEVPMPDVPLRQTAWERALQRFPLSGGQSWAGELASQFRLTPGQIHDAAALVVQRRAMASDEAEVTRAELYAACRKQSHHKLEELAVKIEPHYHWNDLVLPFDKRERLRALCGQVAHRHRVFGDWGFARKVALGRGISALFAGASGTGKTMAADVIAHELQLDLYKIDLSSVVNKYIGETEKNLAKIFHEAEASNAILFFDEADALFGKRTKISDAHDRYANIETSYLLQRVEAYEGIVILATNLRENMDEAFTRRIKFIVDFPFPEVASRKLIWQTHFPLEAPVSDDLDYDWLAQQLQITGGSIKNIVLNAAFFAAADGGVIGMEHILRGARGEFEKIGKLWSDKHFVQPQR
jgi:winged helix domain-containing protein/ATPase family protein associated with various cellular activities (AAA)